MTSCLASALTCSCKESEAEDLVCPFHIPVNFKYSPGDDLHAEFFNISEIMDVKHNLPGAGGHSHFQEVALLPPGEKWNHLVFVHLICPVLCLKKPHMSMNLHTLSLAQSGKTR